MMTTPGVDGLLEGVILGIGNELMPFLANEKAVATAAMMQSILQGLRQVIPVHDAYLIDEHNSMTATLRDAAEKVAGVEGPQADALRQRAASIGQRPDYPTPPNREEVISAHMELTRALESTISELDALQRAGGPEGAAADEAVNVVRAHLAPRYLRDFTTFQVGAGFLGRG